MRLCLFAVALLMPVSAFASVLSVSSPDVKKGEKSIEGGLSWEMDDDPSIDDTREYVLELGYSPTSFWNTAIEYSTEQDGTGEVDYAVTAWKNTFQFIRQKENMPLSAGLRLQYEKAHIDGEADEVAARVLLRHQNDLIDSRLNVGAEREVSSGSDGVWEGDVRASLRYKLHDSFRPAIDYLGDTGSLDDLQEFDAQDHRAGPVIYGAYENVSYEVGYLHGLSDEAPDHTAKLVIGYSF